jgi:hypothetical protein
LIVFAFLGVVSVYQLVKISWLIIIIIGVLLIIGVRLRDYSIPISYVLGIALTYITLTAILFGRPIIKDYANRKPFDSKIWKASLVGNFHPDTRLRMVDDLFKKHNLIGMSKNDIDNLLGIPPNTSYFKNYDYVYRLGIERGIIPIDSEWLAIEFENGKVIKANIVRD